MVVNGNFYIFNHAAYLSKDLGEMYMEKFVEVWRSDLR